MGRVARRARRRRIGHFPSVHGIQYSNLELILGFDCVCERAILLILIEPELVDVIFQLARGQLSLANPVLHLNQPHAADRRADQIINQRAVCILHVLSKMDVIQNDIKGILVLAVVQKNIFPYRGNLCQLLPFCQIWRQIGKVGFRTWKFISLTAASQPASVSRLLVNAVPARAASQLVLSNKSLS